MKNISNNMTNNFELISKICVFTNVKTKTKQTKLQNRLFCRYLLMFGEKESTLNIEKG